MAYGEVKALTYFDRELVLWRGEDGQAVLQDAYCLHLGAHRGVGGWVVGNDLACPWHGWEWDRDGHNARIPYSSEGCKKSLRIRSYPVREFCGAIVAWYSEDPNKQPSWEPPIVPEYGRDDFYEMHPFSTKVFRIRSHVQMPIENAVDPAHIAYIHGNAEIPRQVGFHAEGHWFQSNVAVTYGAGKKSTAFTPNGPVEAIVQMNTYGIGLSVIRWEEPLPTIQMTGFIPVNSEYIDYYFGQCSARPPGSDRTQPEGIAAEFVKVQWKVVEQDFPIWANMTYLQRPSFAAEEAKAYSAMRRWSAQFYPADDRERMLEMAGDLD
ncbi:Rieske 2Fe-2S domain-containing protein [Mycobacterium vicinigordonae]|uniref:Rieske-type oxygenase n=1 Tax=Mycobacterium vicinigordonae TaxID=1719132 RepID=A0A7D6E3C3_9MYCO|nr:Rieske 2Fe-2S domain-containing protein [Mycobacterium vicinigordonae]